MTICTWTFDDPDRNGWSAECGGEFYLAEGTPKQNEMRFCCYCGKPLDEITDLASVGDDDIPGGASTPELDLRTREIVANVRDHYLQLKTARADKVLFMELVDPDFGFGELAPDKLKLR